MEGKTSAPAGQQPAVVIAPPVYNDDDVQPQQPVYQPVYYDDFDTSVAVALQNASTSPQIRDMFRNLTQSAADPAQKEALRDAMTEGPVLNVFAQVIGMLGNTSLGSDPIFNNIMARCNTDLSATNNMQAEIDHLRNLLLGPIVKPDLKGPLADTYAACIKSESLSGFFGISDSSEWGRSGVKAVYDKIETLVQELGEQAALAVLGLRARTGPESADVLKVLKTENHSDTDFKSLDDYVSWAATNTNKSINEIVFAAFMATYPMVYMCTCHKVNIQSDKDACHGLYVYILVSRKHLKAETLRIFKE